MTGSAMKMHTAAQWHTFVAAPFKSQLILLPYATNRMQPTTGMQHGNREVLMVLHGDGVVGQRRRDITCSGNGRSCCHFQKLYTSSSSTTSSEKFDIRCLFSHEKLWRLTVV